MLFRVDGIREEFVAFRIGPKRFVDIVDMSGRCIVRFNISGPGLKTTLLDDDMALNAARAACATLNETTGWEGPSGASLRDRALDASTGVPSPQAVSAHSGNGPSREVPVPGTERILNDAWFPNGWRDDGR